MNSIILSGATERSADQVPGDAAATVHIPADSRAGRALVSMSSDLLIATDLACLACAALMVKVFAHATSGSSADLLPGMGSGTVRTMLLAGGLAPFILRNSRFGALATHGHAGALLRSHVARLAVSAGMVAAIAAVSQARGMALAGPLGTWLGLGLLSTSLARLLMAVHLRRLGLAGRLTEVIAVVGAGARADRLLALLRPGPEAGVEVLGIYDDRAIDRSGGAMTTSGTVADLVELGKTRRIDGIVLTLPLTAKDRVQSIQSRLMALSTPISMCPQHIGTMAVPHFRVDPPGDTVPAENRDGSPAGPEQHRQAGTTQPPANGRQAGPSANVPHWGTTLAAMVREGLSGLARQGVAGGTLTVPRKPGDALLSFTVDDFDLGEFSGEAAAFGMERYAYVVTPNVDHLIRLRDHASFRSLYSSAGYVLLDSRFLSHLLWMTRGISLPVCAGSDLTARLFASVIRRDDPLVLIGATSAQAEQLRSRHGLRRLVHHSPPMGFIHDPAAVEACLRQIESHGPFRFCLLAVGSPQQELIAERLQSRGVARGLALCIGASINFLTGDERRAPAWMRSAGFEWLFRLLQDPARMGYRYLVRGPRLFWLLLRTRVELRPRTRSRHRNAAGQAAPSAHADAAS